MIIGLTNLSIVPGETVDSITTVAPFGQTSMTFLTADATNEASIFLLALLYGVGTAIIYISVAMYLFEK